MRKKISYHTRSCSKSRRVGGIGNMPKSMSISKNSKKSLDSLINTIDGIQDSMTNRANDDKFKHVARGIMEDSSPDIVAVFDLYRDRIHNSIKRFSELNKEILNNYQGVDRRSKLILINSIQRGERLSNNLLNTVEDHRKELVKYITDTSRFIGPSTEPKTSIISIFVYMQKYVTNLLFTTQIYKMVVVPSDENNATVISYPTPPTQPIPTPFPTNNPTILMPPPLDPMPTPNIPRPHILPWITDITMSECINDSPFLSKIINNRNIKLIGGTVGIGIISIILFIMYARSTKNPNELQKKIESAITTIKSSSATKKKSATKKSAIKKKSATKKKSLKKMKKS
jgi:hypothetical protein